MSILKDIDFSTGDLSQFDSVTDTLSKLAATQAAAFGQGWGLECTHDGDATVAVGTTSGLVLPAAGPWRYKFAFNPNGIATLGGARRTGLVKWQSFDHEVAIEGGPGGDVPYELYFHQLGQTVLKLDLTDGWHVLEVRLDTGAKTIKAWLDKASDQPPDLEYSGLTLSAYTTADWGMPTSDEFVDAGDSFYVDQIVISDDDTPLLSWPDPYGQHHLVDHVRMVFGPPLTAAGDAESFDVNGMAGPFNVQGLFDKAGATNEIAIDGSIDYGVSWQEITKATLGATELAYILSVDSGAWQLLRPRLVVLDGAASSCEFTGLAAV